MFKCTHKRTGGKILEGGHFANLHISCFFYYFNTPRASLSSLARFLGIIYKLPDLKSYNPPPPPPPPPPTPMRAHCCSRGCSSLNIRPTDINGKFLSFISTRDLNSQESLWAHEIWATVLLNLYMDNSSNWLNLPEKTFQWCVALSSIIVRSAVITPYIIQPMNMFMSAMV
jgi:hypothetical protein